MTALLDRAIARIRECSPEEQDEAAAVLLDLFDRQETDFVMTPAQARKVEATLAGLQDGSVTIASDEEVQAMWRRFGL